MRANSAFIKQINFGLFLAALILFFMPWTTITVNDESIVSQTGLQKMMGAFPVNDEMAQPEAEEGEQQNEEISYFALIVFLLVLGGVVISGMTLFKGFDSSLSPGLIAAVALAALLLSSIMGFPIDREMVVIEEAMKEEAKIYRLMGWKRSDPELDVSRTFIFFLEMLALTIPAGLYIRASLAGKASANSSESED